MKTPYYLILIATTLMPLAADPITPSTSIVPPQPAVTTDSATIFKAANPKVATAVVVVSTAANDPLESTITSYGGFPSSSDVNHVHRDVTHSFAVAFDAKGTPIEALYVTDSGEVQYTTDDDLLATYSRKAHHLISATSSTVSDDGTHASSGGSGSAPFDSGRSGGVASFHVNGKVIKVGMTKPQVHDLLGSPQHKFQEGGEHEHWLYQPLNVGGDVVHSAVTEVASGFGIFGLAASNAGDTAKPKSRSSTVVFNGNTVTRVDSSSE